jgi:plastocyanin
MFKSVITGLLLVILLISIAITATPLSSLMKTTTKMDVYGQPGSMATLQNIQATYAVSIVPGAAQKNSLIHYYPPSIAVPAGTTVAWFNNDVEQPHTVTSGLPSAPDSGRVFNSGIMPPTANSFFQHTFNNNGDYVYHCVIHPYRLAVVSVSNALTRGNNFEFSSGTGPTLNLTKDLRTLIDFTPLTVPLDKSTPITYNVTISKDKTDKVFSKTFTVNGERLPLELIGGSDINETRVYGPDFSSTGAYHLQAPFLKGKADYTMSVEIAAINFKQPQNKIADQFSFRTIT